MKAGRARVLELASKLIGLPAALWRDRRGNVSTLLGLMLIPLLGSFALAVETSSWYSEKRDAQNAADSAVLAAATNGDTAGSGGSCASKPGAYDCEAKATAARFGFVNGQNNVTVTPAYLTTGCPSGLSACYQVTITKKVPMYLAGVVGFHGSTTIGGQAAEGVQASAWANAHDAIHHYCILALVAGDGTSASNNPGVTSKGGSKTVANGCYIFSDGTAECSGHAQADYVDTAGGSDTKGPTCAQIKYTYNQAVVNDLGWKALASHIPAVASCTLPHSNNLPITGNVLDLTGKSDTNPMTFCGDVTTAAGVTGVVCVKTPDTAQGGAAIIIRDGTLNLPAGVTLKTAGTSGTCNNNTVNGAGLAIVFTGSGLASYGSGKNTTFVSYFPTGSGTLNIAAPTGGNWSGVVLYQDPAMPSGTGVNQTAFGSPGTTPTMDLTGMVFMPSATFVLGGAINKSTSGYQCLTFIVQSWSINGAVGVFDDPLSQCSQAGVTPPSDAVAGATTQLIQ